MRIFSWVYRLVMVSIIATSFCIGQANENRSTGTNVGAELSLQARAESGDRNAQYELGVTAKYRQEYGEAFNWIQLAAKQGLSGAEVDLAFLYLNGLGVEKDFDQAAHWYSLAATQGHPDGEYSLGVCYLHGEGVEQNLVFARHWISLALAHGDGARSVNTLGLSYEVGSQKDYTEALSWYLKAAEMGYAEAQYNVCRVTAQGFANPPDFSAAIRWCSTLAGSGDEWGEFGMGRILEEGVGVQPNLTKAAEWYRKSAEQGNPAAQVSLANMYSEGKGTKRDLVKAYMWVAVAGSGKHPEALDYLLSLTPKMTEHQISEAQVLALDWLKQHPRDPEKSVDHIVYKPD
jgi:TPR repeat protein